MNCDARGIELEDLGGLIRGELGLRATYPRVLFTSRVVRRLGLERRRERRPRGFAHGRQERRVLLIISCLI
jgi:hypothetical protein